MTTPEEKDFIGEVISEDAAERAPEKLKPHHWKLGPMKNLIFVFDRQPDHEGCVFIEVENEQGQSICAGEWREREDGLAELVVPVSYGDELRQQLADVSHERDLLRVERSELEQLLLDVDAVLDSEEISPGYDLELKIAKVYTARAKRAEVKS